eukprot:COSAG04_NODE_481_length_13663_cov_9.055662_8_plen_126_part_00
MDWTALHHASAAGGATAMRATLKQVETILRARDAVLGGEGSTTPTECPLCSEPYTDAEPGLRTPRILQCGHTACQGCYASLLRLAPVDQHGSGHGKRLACPTCREETNVKGGSAENLPKNFVALG